MSAATATTALAAGVDTSDTVTAAPGGAQRCIRRPGARWTTCRCQPCQTRLRRMDKARRIGILPPVDQAAARARLQGWVDAGWSSSAIASAIGVTGAAARKLVVQHYGRQAPMHAATVRRILTATEPAGGRIHSAGSTRRLQALAWMGWDRADVEAWTTLSARTLSMIRQGHRGHVTLDAARSISAIYAELSARPGPSDVARRTARRSKWAPPAAWDDDTIDLPAAQPQGMGASSRNVTDPVVISRVQELTRTRATDTEIGYEIGLTASGVQKLRTRYGIRRAA